MSKLFRKSARREGFTLIELIVVITILGILVAIAVPRLGAFRREAEDKKHESNVRIVKGAAAMWLAANGIPAADKTFVVADLDDYLEPWVPVTGTIWPDGVLTVQYVYASGNILVTPMPSH